MPHTSNGRLVLGQRRFGAMVLEQRAQRVQLACKLREDVMQLVQHLALDGPLGLDVTERLQQGERALGAAQLPASRWVGGIAG